MREQSLRVETHHETPSEIDQVHSWIETSLIHLATILAKREKALTIYDPEFKNLEKELKEIFTGEIPEIYTLILEKITSIIRSHSSVEGQEDDLNHFLKKIHLFQSFEHLTQFLKGH